MIENLNINLHRVHATNRRALYAYLYGSERALQQAIDEEGCSVVFTSLKANLWGPVTGDADGDMPVTEGDARVFQACDL